MSKELVMDLRVVALFIVALYCTAEVSAEVIYGVPRPDRDNGWVDMDDNGTLDFSFINVIQFPIIGQPDVFTFSVDPRSDFAPQNSAWARDQYGNIARLPLSHSVGGKPETMIWLEPSRSGHIAIGVGGTWSAPWATDPISMIGVRFESAAGLHFGWIRLRVETWTEHVVTDSGLPAQFVHGPEVLDWAYESTPNTPIVAGAVPEPTSVALAVVGVIAAISWRWRRGSWCARSSGG